MFRQILFAQWKATQWPLLILGVITFALPLGSASAFAAQRVDEWAPFMPLVAIFGAFSIGGLAWAWDQMGKNVYALSLPLARWEYMLLKMAAGAMLLAIPTATMWVGALIAVSATDLPVGFHAYPTALAVRFGLAALLSYSAFFAFSGARQRTQLALIGVFFATVIGGGIYLDTSAGEGLGRFVEKVLTERPGPLEVFVGSWRLFDV
ncbi:MAG: hypothetical protein ACE5FJ_03400 [Gemmatimonadales bacterium]